MRFSNTLSIDRPVADVFNYLAKFENLPAWNYAISETRSITDGPVGVGSRYRQFRTIPKRSEETFEVIEFEPDHRLAIRGTFGPFPAESVYLLEPVGAAAQLTNTMDLRAKGPVSLIAPVATRQIKSAVAANLQKLKQILEGA